MKRAFVKTLFVILATFTLSVSAQNVSDFEWSKTVSKKTDSIKQEFGLTDKNQFARLIVKVKLESGRIAWRLKDPNGEVRLNGQITNGRGKGDSGKLEAIAGQWTLEFDLQDATGNYTVNWTAR